MKCPRCSSEMRVMTARGVELDVCYGGCGGMWFDRFEFRKLDEKGEADPAFMADIEQHRTITPPVDPRISCPRCANLPLMRHVLAPRSRIHVDDCPGCGGMWLDGGELAQVHEDYPTESLRNAAKTSFISDVFVRSRSK